MPRAKVNLKLEKPKPKRKKTRRKRKKIPKSVYIKWARDFKKRFGYFPAQDDLKKPNRDMLQKLFGIEVPHATTIARRFGSWSIFREACGETPSKYTPSHMTEEISIAYMKKKYGMVEVEAENSIVDGYIGDRAVEVKGGRLKIKKTDAKYPSFEWNLHEREYSKLVDELYLIGMDDDGNVLLEICIPTRGHLLNVADGKASLKLSGSALVKGSSASIVWPYVVAYKPLTLEELENYCD